jgi:hypothetical protein
MVFHPPQCDHPHHYSDDFPPLPNVGALSVHDQPEFVNNMPNRDVSHRPNSEGINDDDWDSSSPSDPDNDRYCEQIRRLLRRQPGETRSQHYERIDQQQLSQRRNLHFGHQPSPCMNSNEFNNYDSDDIAELLGFNSEDFTDSDSDDDSDSDQDSSSPYDSDNGGMPPGDLYRFHRENLGDRPPSFRAPSFRQNRHPFQMWPK